MAEPEPYIRKNPGDIIRSADWNEAQVLARAELHAHTHAGEALGPQLTGDAIDPSADVTVASLTVTGELKVRGTALLDQINDLSARIGFTRTDYRHTEADSLPGQASIENDGGDYNALMIFGRNIAAAGEPPDRRVRLLDHLSVEGRLRCGNVRQQVSANNEIQSSDTSFSNIEGMSLVFELSDVAPMLLIFSAGGVLLSEQGFAKFRLQLDGSTIAETAPAFQHGTWQDRDVILTSLCAAEPGKHMLTVAWAVSGSNVRMYGSINNSTRRLIAVEL